MDTAMRKFRLTGLLMALHDRGPVPGAKLAEATAMGRRTIGRDIAHLTALGAPVVAARGPGGGYDLAPWLRERITDLPAAEIERRFNEAVRRGGDGEAFQEAFSLQRRTRLRTPSAATSPDVTNVVSFDPTDWDGGSSFSEKLELVREAILDRVEVSFTDDGARRRLRPLHIRMKGAVGFVLGVVDGETRWVSNYLLGDARREADTFVPPKGISVEAEWERAMRDGGRSLRKLRVRITLDPNFFGDFKAQYLITARSEALNQGQKEAWVEAPSIEGLIRDLPLPQKGLRILDPPGLQRHYERERMLA